MVLTSNLWLQQHEINHYIEKYCIESTTTALQKNTTTKNSTTRNPTKKPSALQKNTFRKKNTQKNTATKNIIKKDPKTPPPPPPPQKHHHYLQCLWTESSTGEQQYFTCRRTPSVNWIKKQPNAVGENPAGFSHNDAFCGIARRFFFCCALLDATKVAGGALQSAE